VAPAFFFTNPHVGIGAFDDVERFPDSTLFDLECEVGVVHGAHGRNLTPEQAGPGVVGCTIFNDWSARDIQKLEGQLPFGFFKGRDGAHTLGPYLVTPDEREPYRTPDGFLDQAMRAHVNGELLGEDSLANMAWTFEELISFASRGSAVAPGDLLGSGTCHQGCLTEIWARAGQRVPPPLAPGDVVTLEVEALGTVRNRVVEPPLPPPIPRSPRPAPRPPPLARPRGPPFPAFPRKRSTQVRDALARVASAEARDTPSDPDGILQWRGSWQAACAARRS
jgi:2-keto-4-pentenoate hydratase/2-oxohepta-3-ene-1,7-dioic acid hydratase in catechol pathway